MITSAANPRLKLVRRLASRRQRERLGLFSCEGEDLVAAALAAGLQPVELLVDAERPPQLAGVDDGEPVEPRLLAELSTLGHPSRVVAVFRRADLPRLQSAEPSSVPPVGLCLWHVVDPGNVGTILRAADGLGPAFVALSPGCADPTGPKALRASMGAVFRVRLADFASAPGRRVALDPRGQRSLAAVSLDEPTTFVLGAEREGLPADVLAECEVVASIPLAPGAESLNVALAGAIALYEWNRRRG